MEITTTHYATWQYIFDDTASTDYEFRTRDLLERRVEFVVSLFVDVYQNTSFCCQWEGFQVQSDNIESLNKAINEIHRYFIRFKKIQEI